MNCEWVSIYTDGSTFKQVENGKENLFKDIDMSRLKVFSVFKYNNIISVDIESGVFYINGSVLEVNGFSNLGEDYRLIYFKRNYKSMSTRAEGQSSVDYYVGFQVTIDDTNYKVLLKVKDNGVEIEIQ